MTALTEGQPALGADRASADRAGAVVHGATGTAVDGGASAMGPEGTARDRRRATVRPVDAADGGVDRLFDRVRGNPVADFAALVLSDVSDYGFVWAVLAAAKARRPGPARRRAVQALVVAGVVSATVNTVIKRVVGRTRPERDPHAVAPALLPVRRPTSSSFPSGHTLAAFCTAVVLPERRRGIAINLVLAAAVAASRVHLRAHHASDVVGGAAVGTVAGAVARRLLLRSATDR